MQAELTRASDDDDDDLGGPSSSGTPSGGGGGVREGGREGGGASLSRMIWLRVVAEGVEDEGGRRLSLVRDEPLSASGGRALNSQWTPRQAGLSDDDTLLAIEASLAVPLSTPLRQLTEQWKAKQPAGVVPAKGKLGLSFDGEKLDLAATVGEMAKKFDLEDDDMLDVLL
ncbi:hypothetical protein EMIHUDRAFT_223867 [Emiliania huxleyi CCMP1516]|uniref:Rad60/SUMO-like domain-containing protein n=2 Tax=Emiliania huxleyi TaxID=2903 RepID=A0A0D3KTD2_EMIH1|nr:hypothetical protein EMIHUDRAFT_223867 [Emiliania huxleyi CCMP1516]EOD39017.1 hypothetical protein EMIHUDRAFT_223867 [Emiliania huxleyi CCMP1516]|eukprot:XP_005791446.1 hypothetical protein EMIHUDRAFT_223867 [Emiliania huxleyi CCMP1516]